ncbi:ALF repeat-containing protein [Acaricomes phytoseiuli]|uniref:ALF repeat-containing protein n=1 Tax=Acaricomes phytoseiuli TaxID=291968 RepID=UPI002223B20D|nr:ALF repeat-containing protein [Acaricomes phytoseiuli]MCW1250685.1 ALF repeat-containing protein [Acaricomes phytoseiuli]
MAGECSCRRSGIRGCRGVVSVPAQAVAPAQNQSEVIPAVSGGVASDRASVVRLWLEAAPVVSAPAREALLGDEQVLQDFIDNGQFQAQIEDDRQSLIQMSLVGRSTVRDEVNRVLADGQAQVLRDFVAQGWKLAWQIDDRREVSDLATNGTPQVKSTAQQALAEGNPGIQQFIVVGRENTERSEKRRWVSRFVSSTTSVSMAAQEVNRPGVSGGFLKRSAQRIVG